MGFMRPPLTNPQLTSSLLFEEGFSVVLRKSSPLARRRRIRLQDFAQENVLMIDRNISPRFNEKMLELFRNAGITPKIIPTETMPCDEAGAILVESGKGIYLAVGEGPYYPSFADRLVALPIDERSAVMPVHIVWRKDEKAKTTLEFVRYAQSTCKETREFKRMRPKAGGRRRKPTPLRRGRR